MGKYDGYLQGLSIAAILILAPLALQSLLSQDEAQVVYAAVPVEMKTKLPLQIPSRTKKHVLLS